MLRHKLVMILGSIIVLFLIAAVLAMVVLQDVLEDMGHVCHDAMAGVHTATALSSTITRIEAELEIIEVDDGRHLDHLIAAMETLEEDVAALGETEAVKAEGMEAYDRLETAVPMFMREVSDLATTHDPELTRIHTRKATLASAEMQEAVGELVAVTQQHARAEQDAVTGKFKAAVLGLAVVFLVLINASIIVLLRAASMVLRPVDQLVDASRRLAREEFDHRVAINQKDEFAELAHAYNHLAEQLQQNEQLKLETLQQLARTLSHELNNAMAIIELKLSLLARHSAKPEQAKESLEQIRGALERMGATVKALARIRRIVLTDYLDGVKMVDLERSTEDEEATTMVGATRGGGANAHE